MAIEDAKLRKIENGFIVSTFSMPEDTDGPVGPGIRSKFKEEFFTGEEEAGNRMKELAKKMKS